MKNSRIFKGIILVLVSILAVLSFTACGADMDIGGNGELTEEFLDRVVSDDYLGAYNMVKESAKKEEFDEFYMLMRESVKGAEDYEIEQTGWRVSTQNGVTSNITEYRVNLDNGRIILFRAVSQDNVNGLIGAYFTDVTDFINNSEELTPKVNIVLIILSVLMLAFVIFMFVDCIRRRIKKKVLWAIIIFLGVGLSVTFGETSGINLFIGLIFGFNTFTTIPASLSYTIKIVMPIGAIVYAFMRKKLTLTDENNSPEGSDDTQNISCAEVPTESTESISGTPEITSEDS
jgi:hypothetical protein